MRDEVLDNTISPAVSCADLTSLMIFASFFCWSISQGGRTLETPIPLDYSDKEVDEVVFKLVDGAVVKIIVKTGISDYQRIEVIEGLNDGEEIVSGPFLAVSKRLKDGDKVTVTNKKAEKKSVASTE